MTLEKLFTLGFDRSAHTFGRKNLLSVACSQCQATVINGVPCHKAGCSNNTRKTKLAALRAKGAEVI
jgi:hypothetical protein